MKLVVNVPMLIKVRDENIDLCDPHCKGFNFKKDDSGYYCWYFRSKKNTNRGTTLTSTFKGILSGVSSMFYVKRCKVCRLRKSKLSISDGVEDNG